ncbi:MAG: hypothetical protein OXT67_12850 [Zetaproteobacteria bacterium]|nr:hypothetical protein [Zetaproteobacteria bacterium]
MWKNRLIYSVLLGCLLSCPHRSFAQNQSYYAEFKAAKLDIGKEVTLGHKVRTALTGTEQISVRGTYYHQVVEVYLISRRGSLRRRIYSKMDRHRVFIFPESNIPAELGIVAYPETLPNPIAIESATELRLKLALDDARELAIHSATLTQDVQRKNLKILLSSAHPYTIHRRM